MWGDYDDRKIRSSGYDVGTDRRVYGIFMQPGFAMVETGFTRAKNAGNIVMKILWICVWAVSFFGSLALA